MKSIKNLTFLSLALSILAACGGGAGGDKAAQLATLKSEKAALETKITALETEINAGKPVERKLKTVGTSPLATETFQHFIDLQGKVDADQSQEITSKMPGTLKRVLIKVGDNVSAGQLVAELDGETMNAQIEEMRRQLTFAIDIYNRQKGLWDQKIGAEVQFLQAKNGKESIEGAIATMEENRKNLRIYSPISGVVDMVIGKAGGAISPGMPLANVLNLSKLKITGNVTEAYVSKVGKGDAVNVFFPDLNREIKTRVTYVSKIINPTNRTFSVECALPAGSDWRANQVAVLKIIDYTKPNALVVPINVIQQSETGDFILLADKTGEKGGTVRKADIKQGQNYNGKVEVLTGLKKGDLLITTGFQDVNNGETINF